MLFGFAAKGLGPLHGVGVTAEALSMVVTACPGFVMSWRNARWETDGL